MNKWLFMGCVLAGLSLWGAYIGAEAAAYTLGVFGWISLATSSIIAAIKALPTNPTRGE